MSPSDRRWDALPIGRLASPLHPHADADEWEGIALAAPKIVVTSATLLDRRADLHGRGPACAVVMVAGTWNLPVAEIRRIEDTLPITLRVDDAIELVIRDPLGADHRRWVSQLLATIGRKPAPEPRPPPGDEHSATWYGGSFAVDIGPIVAAAPGASGTVRVRAELGPYRSSELAIELRSER